MSSLNGIDKLSLEELLSMKSGYVIDSTFTDRKFAEYFRDTVGIDISSDKYQSYGSSKAKRLRAFWEKVPNQLVGTILSGLLELWEMKNPQANRDLFNKCKGIVGRLLGSPVLEEDKESSFLIKDYSKVSLKDVDIDDNLKTILEYRLNEVDKCIHSDASLAVIMLCGSILEGLLLNQATRAPKEFNQAPSSPKDKDGKVKKFPDWSLAELIDVAYDEDFLKLDVKKFSHALRHFRNYIHPYEQMSSGFHPDTHTAKICLQILKAAIASLAGQRR